MKAWEKNIRKVVPYVPGEQPNKERMIKLNTNENPYPPAPGVAEALKNLDPDRLRLYPDPACTRLVDAIAKQKGLKSELILCHFRSRKFDFLCCIVSTLITGYSCQNRDNIACQQIVCAVADRQCKSIRFFFIC